MTGADGRGVVKAVAVAIASLTVILIWMAPRGSGASRASEAPASPTLEERATEVDPDPGGSWPAGSYPLLREPRPNSPHPPDFDFEQEGSGPDGKKPIPAL